jgi:cytochrome c-type biogenesis protein CcmH/NrfF
MARGLAPACLLFMVISLALSPARAETDSSVPKWAYDLAHELMSPYCPGRTLAECPSPQAAELRIWIHTQAAAGATPDEVREMLYDRFGDIVRGAPRAEGWGLSAYLVPIFFFVLGGPVVVWIIRRMMRPAAGVAQLATRSPTAPAEVDPELERMLEAELRDL